MRDVPATADFVPALRMPCPACDGEGVIDAGEIEVDRKVGGIWPVRVRCEACRGEGSVPYAR